MNKLVHTLHLWTNGDQSVGSAGESADISAPDWLIDRENYDEESLKIVLEDFRAKACEAFSVIWPNERVYARYDFELAAENACQEQD